MTGQNPLQRYEPGGVARRDGGSLAPHQRVDGSVHAPGDLHLSAAVRMPDECWEMLSPQVRERIAARAGSIVDRWAYEDAQDRVSAVVLGERGLVTVEPTVNREGGRASAIQVLSAQAGSVRSMRVVEDTSISRYAPGAVTPAGSDTRQAGLAARLPADFVDFLGNFPARAQLLVQEPFLSQGGPVYCDHYYTQSGPAQGAGLKTLRVWCYLTDRRRVTFASGQATTYGPSFISAQWQVTCWRFDVQPAGRA